MELVEGALNAAKLGLRGCDCYARFQAADDRNRRCAVSAVARFIHLDQRIELGVAFLVDHAEAEARRRHADNLIGLGSERDLAAENVRAAMKTVLPKIVSDHGHRWTIHVFRPEGSPSLGFHAQGIEKVGGDDHAEDAIVAVDPLEASPEHTGKV